MGLSTRNFIYDKDSDSLNTITNSKFEGLFSGDPSVSLKEYANKIIKYITVIVEIKNRKPVAIVDMHYGLLKLDRAGRVDRGYKNEMDHDLASIMSSALMSLNKPENVIDSASDFARDKYRKKYTWTPTAELVARIQEIILKKAEQRKLSEIIIEIAEVGLNNKKFHESDIMHRLFFLAHVAWNRDTKHKNYMTGSILLENLSGMPGTKKQIKRELISSDWEEIVSEMLKYKRKHFPYDIRKITTIGYTPWNTVRVEWEH